MALNLNNNSTFFTSDIIESTKKVKHLFSTKISGSYSSCLESLQNKKCGNPAVELMLEEGFNIDNLVFLKQVHGDKFCVIDQTHNREFIGMEADALITVVPQVPILVFTADCVPILIVDKNRKIAAAVHAGWKGTRLKIVSKIVSYMIDNMNCKSEEIVAAIGPCIGSCCFEVSKDVYDQFNFKHIVNEKYFVDLNKENRAQLLELGIKDYNIDSKNICTMHNKELFHSYRREHDHAGRQISLIQLF